MPHADAGSGQEEGGGAGGSAHPSSYPRWLMLVMLPAATAAANGGGGVWRRRHGCCSRAAYGVDGWINRLMLEPTLWTRAAWSSRRPNGINTDHALASSSCMTRHTCCWIRLTNETIHPFNGPRWMMSRNPTPRCVHPVKWDWEEAGQMIPRWSRCPGSSDSSDRQAPPSSHHDVEIERRGGRSISIIQLAKRVVGPRPGWERQAVD